MNTKKIALKAEFGAETRFELQPVDAFRAIHENEFERLKARLLAIRQQEAGVKWEALLRDAANEAAALAWTTPSPLLVFSFLESIDVNDVGVVEPGTGAGLAIKTFHRLGILRQLLFQ